MIKQTDSFVLKAQKLLKPQNDGINEDLNRIHHYHKKGHFSHEQWPFSFA
jgi:hypothetical protein